MGLILNILLHLAKSHRFFLYVYKQYTKVMGSRNSMLEFQCIIDALLFRILQMAIISKCSITAAFFDS
jgi:hypothetical protein